jgi:phosphoribosylformylglycinamidine synthase
LDALLFGESQGRVLISVSKEESQEILESASKLGLSVDQLGSSNSTGRLKFSVAGNEVLDSEVNQLHKIWNESIPQKMNHS